MKLTSPVFDKNKDPIIEQLLALTSDRKNLLEIGSGSGQHSHFFAKKMPSLNWQSSDCDEKYKKSIRAYIEEEPLTNLKAPIQIDLLKETWSRNLEKGRFDCIFSMNVIHIVAWEGTLSLIKGAKEILNKNGLLIFYGPFKFRKRELEPSNHNFDLHLQNVVPGGGLRYFDDICDFARKNSFILRSEISMPANNKTLVFEKC